MTETLKVSIRKTAGNDDLPLPKYMTEHAAGMDLFAAVKNETVLFPGERELISAGIVIAVPEGYEGEVRPRSGLAIHHGITLLNSPGTIDADYRGEVGIIMINHGTKPFIVKRGDRIAQLIIRPVCQVLWDENGNVSQTERGRGGFGHTK